MRTIRRRIKVHKTFFFLPFLFNSKHPTRSLKPFIARSPAPCSSTQLKVNMSAPRLAAGESVSNHPLVSEGSHLPSARFLNASDIGVPVRGGRTFCHLHHSASVRVPFPPLVKCLALPQTFRKFPPIFSLDLPPLPACVKDLLMQLSGAAPTLKQ